jgi:hypothetical protein
MQCMQVYRKGKVHWLVEPTRMWLMHHYQRWHRLVQCFPTRLVVRGESDSLTNHDMVERR